MKFVWSLLHVIVEWIFKILKSPQKESRIGDIVDTASTASKASIVHTASTVSTLACAFACDRCTKSLYDICRFKDQSFCSACQEEIDSSDGSSSDGDSQEIWSYTRLLRRGILDWASPRKFEVLGLNLGEVGSWGYYVGEVNPTGSNLWIYRLEFLPGNLK